MSDLAVYDMDRTVTRRATYTPFLLHCAARRAPWRLLFVPLVLLSMLAYVTRLIDRATLKEINHQLLLGGRIHPRDLKRIVRALEVFFLTGRPLTAHFAETASPSPKVARCPPGRGPGAGLTRRTLYSRMERHGLRTPGEGGAEEAGEDESDAERSAT